MLKRPHVSPLVRRAGVACLLLLGLAGAGAVHAWRASELRAEAAAAETADAGMVDVAMDLSVFTLQDGMSRRVQASPRMCVQLGKEGKLIMNGTPDRPTPEQVVITLKALSLSGGRWQLDLQLAQGLPLQLLGQPRIIVLDGEPGRVEVGGADSRRLSLQLTARRANPNPPGATPPGATPPTASPAG